MLEKFLVGEKLILNAVSLLQTMRRQRTEVVVELRKVRTALSGAYRAKHRTGRLVLLSRLGRT